MIIFVKILKMLVRYFTLLIFCSVYIYSFGQYAGRGSKDISKILSKNDTILFILSGDEKFDNNLMYSIENHWTFSPWDTMSIQKRKDINLKGYKSSQLVLVFNVEMLRQSSLSMGRMSGMGNPMQIAKYQLEYGLIQKKDAFSPFDVTADLWYMMY